MAMRYWVIWTALVAISAPATALAACGGTFTAPSGTIRSPRFPKWYPSNQTCVYTVLASPDARVKFWCKRSILQASLGCTKDYIKVNGIYTCGRNRLSGMYGQGSLTIEFVSDAFTNRKGFLCYYERVTGGEYVAQTTSTTTSGEQSEEGAPCTQLLTVTTEWNTGLVARFHIPVHTPVTSWRLDVSFNLPINTFEQWTGMTTEHSKTWYSVSKDNDPHGAGSMLSFDFLYRFDVNTRPSIASVKLNGQDMCTGSNEEGTTTTTTPGSNEGTTTTPGSNEGSTTTTTPPPEGGGCPGGPYDYDEVLHKSLLFYEAQRSGYLPASHRVAWRRHSATDDALDADTNVKVDLEGGYYDAGDYVKFGFPMAGMATVLAWGAIEYKSAYTSAGEMDNVLAAVKWATDYFLKAHPEANVFYGQVGRGDLDHSYWGRPEDMAMARPAYKITESRPGSDLAGETSASLAAASILFKDSNSEYSSRCLRHAQELYHFADTFRGKYSDSIQDAAQYYYSYGVYHDELAWAAVWLYRATGNRTYLTKAKAHYNDIYVSGVGEFSWAEKTPGVQVLLAQVADPSDTQVYKDHLKIFCDKIVDQGKRTPKGLVFISKWGSLRYAANVAYICLRAADLGIRTDHYRHFGREQIHYMLGSAGRSFVVGFGVNPPQRPHHASSSCKDPPASCDWSDFKSSAPNPHVLYGALVGGPDERDNYQDNRQDYISNEVTCDYNAGFQSAVAALRQLSDCGEDTTSTPPGPDTTTRTPTPTTPAPDTTTRTPTPTTPAPDTTTRTTTPTTPTPDTTKRTPTPTTPAPETTSSNSQTTTTVGGGNTCARIVPGSEWAGNYQVYLTIRVPSDITSWTIVLNFSQAIDNFQVWDALASPTSGSAITLVNKDYNGVQSGGADLTIKFWVTWSGADSKPAITTITFNGVSQCLS